MDKEPDEPKIPELQLEFAGQGPGSGARTAVSAGDFFSPIDPSVLPDAPWWFMVFDPWVRNDCRAQFHEAPLDEAMKTLEAAGIPPLYRLGLGLRWGFIEPLRDNFRTDDLGALLTHHGLMKKSLTEEMDLIEKRSLYRLWRKYGHNIRCDLAASGG